MPAVARVAGDLADVIDVVDDRLERHAGGLRRRFAADPAGHHHPGVERRADDRAALDQPLDLIVA